LVIGLVADFPNSHNLTLGFGEYIRKFQQFENVAGLNLLALFKELLAAIFFIIKKTANTRTLAERDATVLAVKVKFVYT
jgi:hypothetical protein